jgi:cell division septation protein DedD
MRDLEKIKSKKVYNMDKGRISLVLATGITLGIMVFLVGLFLGLKKPNEAAASPLDPLEALISESGAKAQQVAASESGSGPEVSFEYASKLSEEKSEPTPAEAASQASGDDPLPAEPVMEVLGSPAAGTTKVPGSFKVPENPGDIAYVEPAHSAMSVKGEKGIFTLHINSFSNKSEATGYVSQLRKMGYKAFLVATDTDDRGTIYRVRIGPFLSKNEAEKYRRKFEEKEGIPTYVVKRVLDED